MGGFAWVTLATNDSYCLGALVLAHSLKRAGTKHDIAVLITPGVTDTMREKLTTIFTLVKEVNVLDSQDAANLALLARPELGITFTKLHCWRLTQYEKCVFVDADTLVLRNCDELFEREELSAAPDVGWPDCFNSGVFVFKPSQQTFASLTSFAVSRGSFDGGDQGLLNLFFSDWAHKDISKHLPFIYNMCSAACYSYLPAYKQFGGDAKIVHFIGNAKPWLQQFDSQTGLVNPSSELGHLQSLLQYWWNIFFENVHPQLSSEMASSILAQLEHNFLRSQSTKSTILNTSQHMCHMSIDQMYDEVDSVVNFSEFHDPWDNYIEYDNSNSSSSNNDNHDNKHIVHNQHQVQYCFVENNETSDSNIFSQFSSSCFSEKTISSIENNNNNNNNNNSPNTSNPIFSDNNSHSTQQLLANNDKLIDDLSKYVLHKLVDINLHYQSVHSNSNDNSNNNDNLAINQSNTNNNNNKKNSQDDYKNLPDNLEIEQSEKLNNKNNTNNNRNSKSDPNIELIKDPLIDIKNKNCPSLSCRERIEENSDITTVDSSVINMHSLTQSTQLSQSALSCTKTPCISRQSDNTSSTNQVDDNYAGIAGVLAQLTLGAARTPEQIAYEEHMRKQSWEHGQIDYMGRDSFDNIWKKICTTLSSTTEEGTPVQEKSPPLEAQGGLIHKPPSQDELTSKSAAAEPTDVITECNIKETDKMIQEVASAISTISDDKLAQSPASSTLSTFSAIQEVKDIKNEPILALTYPPPQLSIKRMGESTSKIKQSPSSEALKEASKATEMPPIIPLGFSSMSQPVAEILTQESSISESSVPIQVAESVLEADIKESVFEDLKPIGEEAVSSISLPVQESISAVVESPVEPTPILLPPINNRNQPPQLNGSACDQEPLGKGISIRCTPPTPETPISSMPPAPQTPLSQVTASQSLSQELPPCTNQKLPKLDPQPKVPEQVPFKTETIVSEKLEQSIPNVLKTLEESEPVCAKECKMKMQPKSQTEMKSTSEKSDAVCSKSVDRTCETKTPEKFEAICLKSDKQTAPKTAEKSAAVCTKSEAVCKKPTDEPKTAEIPESICSKPKKPVNEPKMKSPEPKTHEKFESFASKASEELKGADPTTLVESKISETPSSPTDTTELPKSPKKTVKKVVKKVSEEKTEGSEVDDVKKSPKKVVKKIVKKPKVLPEEGESSAGDKPKKMVKVEKKGATKTAPNLETEMPIPDSPSSATSDAPVPPKRKSKSTVKSTRKSESES